MNKQRLPLYCLLFLASQAQAQTDVPVNREKYPDFPSQLNPDPSLMVKGAGAARAAAARGADVGEQQRARARAAKLVRPTHVNNGANIYFPPVFNQDGGSCGSASRISYMFNYELNALRKADGSLVENQYPSHFTWLLTNSNSGKEGMAAANGVPNSLVYGGRTYSRLFGNQDCANPDFGWMQGYDKWYHAMQNRITSNGNFPVSVESEEGREAVKNWLWNHNGDTDFGAGGIVGIGVASGGNWQPIPSTPTNDDIGVTNQYYVKAWGSQVDHALTIVGYDDRIEFDLDGNGVAGEKAKDEVGAWIVVNSWGEWWCNGGFIYCPYKHAAPVTASDGSHSGYWQPEVYYARKNYRPLRTLKITMDYSKRSELSLAAGISADLEATEPDGTVAFEHFKYAGDGDGDGVDAETPMLGRWADGMHSEAMEFGYDLTDLSAGYDTRRPLKYFFIINSKGTANGEGKIHACSLIDYEFDKAGIELPFDIPADGVEVKTQGERTIISVIVPGEPVNAPLNLVRNDKSLVWQAPQTTPFTLKGYKVYCNGEYIALATDTRYTIEDADAIYRVSALYEMPDGGEIESKQSNPTLAAYDSETGSYRALTLTNNGFEIPGAFENGLSKATIEFYIRPTSVVNWNQQIGPGWGQFLFHANSDGHFSAGWSNSERFESAAGVLSANSWHHIAIVVDGGLMTFYKNGRKLGELKSTNYSGLPKMLNFPVGRNGESGLKGSIDEFRVWGEARTAEQIANSRQVEVAYPSAEPNLLAYYRMQNGLISEGGTQTLKDFSAYGNDAPIYVADGKLTTATGFILKSKPVVADFTEESPGTHYAGDAVTLKNLSSANGYEWTWSAPTSKEKTANIPNPTFTFEAAGSHDVTLTVKGVCSKADSVSTVTKQIEVAAVEKPVAAFTVSAKEVPAGDRVMLTNRTTAAGCTYEWTMTGAEVEKCYTTNAAAAYPKDGSYTITLTATNAAGSSSHSETVVATKVAPLSDFQINPSAVMKGELVYLVDKSKYAPESWQWQLKSSGNTIEMEGASSSFTPTQPGVYDAQLITRNAVGADTAVQKRALVVCNADSKSGLNFSTGAESVSFAPIFDAGEKVYAFTAEWWMNPASMQGDGLHIGDSESTLMIRSTAKGEAVVSVRGNSFTTDEPFFIASEWHHYALSYSRGEVTLWRDGVEFYSKKVVTNATQYALPEMEKFALGSDLAPMRGQIDELRVWKKSLTEERVTQYANAPIDNVTEAESDGLRLYCDFNQSEGAVQDRTSNKNNGQRIGFGPEGDAWGKSLGVFSLSAKPVDVTADYLTNYKAPFLSTDKLVNPGSERFKELEQGTETSGWLIENNVKEGDVTTEFYVDGTLADNFALMTGSSGFATAVTDLKAYQTLRLPAGSYTLTVKEGQRFNADGVQLAAALGKSLPDASQLAAEALAVAPLSEKELVFNVAEEGEVTVGLVANVGEAQTLAISAFALERSGYQFVIPNGETGISIPTAGNSSLTVSIEKGALVFSAPQSTEVEVYDISGRLAERVVVDGTQRVKLPQGVYVVNGEKVLVP